MRHVGLEPPRLCNYEACPTPDAPLTGRRDQLKHPECKDLARRARRDGVVHHRALEAFTSAIAHARPRRLVSSAMRDRGRARAA